jgi:hypothetical protein
VSYTPPPYLPPPAGARDEKTVTLGIVANPAKVSRGFLDELRRRLPAWEAQAASDGRQLRVQFIDQRYQQASIRARIEAALSASAVAVDFLTPVGHQAYLIAVGRLDAVIDTWPYTGGLTTVEALAMGVPVYTHSGALFCERHSAAHCAYAGFELAEVDLGRFDGLPRPVPSEGRLIAATEPASRHDALAEELLPYLRARPRNLRLPWLPLLERNPARRPNRRRARLLPRRRRRRSRLHLAASRSQSINRSARMQGPLQWPSAVL